FRWAADHGDLDDAVAIATYVGLLGFGVENYEPVAWAEELVEPARAAEHPRLLALCVIATLCWMAGRVEGSIQYTEVGEILLASDQRSTPYGMEAWLGAVYLALGQPERWARFCEAQLERRGDDHVYVRACRVFALTFAGAVDEAAVAAKG